jgi:hypothetical protein
MQVVIESRLVVADVLGPAAVPAIFMIALAALCSV